MWAALLHYANIVINWYIAGRLIYLNFRRGSIDIGLGDSSCKGLLFSLIFIF